MVQRQTLSRQGQEGKKRPPHSLRNSMKFKFEFLACLCSYTHPEWECWRQPVLGGGQTSGVFFFPTHWTAGLRMGGGDN